MGNNGLVNSVLDTPELVGRVGGVLGPRARLRGAWFDPARFAIVAAGVTMVVVYLRQLPCRPLPGDFPNAFLRMCYSDITTLYLGRGISTGAGIYSQAGLEYPVLTGYFVMAARWVTGLFNNVTASATHDQQVAASVTFLVVCSIGLTLCFLAAVVAHLLLGKDFDAARTGAVQVRSWDAVLIAASPVVMANGLISWDLLVVALTSWGLLAWARRKPLIAGAVLGLAVAAKFYPVLVLIAIGLLCLRAGKMAVWLATMLSATIAWLVVNLPVMLLSWRGWSQFWTMNYMRGADLGSIWYVLSLVGIQVPALSATAFAFMAAGGIGVMMLVLRAPRRPRLAQVALLVLIVFLIFNKVYSPQYALWLLPLVVLARPKLVDVGVWTLSELVYFAAIWGFLEGIIGPGSGSDWLYWAAVLARVCVQLWIALRVIDDILRPWDDPVRMPFVDDPTGGVLDFADDAAWLTGRQHAGTGSPGPAAGRVGKLDPQLARTLLEVAPRFETKTVIGGPGICEAPSDSEPGGTTSLPSRQP